MAEENITPETEPTEGAPVEAVKEENPVSEPNPEPAPDPAQEEEGGKGSKEAVLADLARERDRRQEEQAARAKDAETFEAERTAWQAERDQLTREIALYRNGEGANIPALLDSKSFTEKLAALTDFTDETVKELITETVEANPAFATTPTKPAGVRDASAGSTHEPTAPTDWLRAAFQNL